MGSERVGTVVVGAGPIGSSAARHLSLQPSAGSVVVVGPDEPPSLQKPGPFGAWFDEARLTRVVADDDVWATLAEESIDRYPSIASAGGEEFHRTQGVLYVHELEAGYDRQMRVAARHRAVVSEGAPDDYPYLRMPAGTRLIHERGGAGTVNPRLLVANQLRAAQAAGARLVRDHVVGVEPAPRGGALVRLAAGDALRADRVVVAAGAYVDRFDLLPAPLPVHAVGITAMFFRVDAAAAATLADMPCLLWHQAEGDEWFYSVPPTVYPDGGLWFKIGGHHDHGRFATRDDVDDWFRSAGSAGEAEFLAAWVAEHIPVLAGSGAHRIGCAITETPTGFPIIDEVAPGVVVATGCAGASAKSCDEIGRIAAVLSAQGVWDSALDRAVFSRQSAASA